MIRTSPGSIEPERIAARQSSSHSKTRAGPVRQGFFTPEIFATLPSLARFPFKTAKWPFAYSGFDKGLITS
jgi:hypothetical protein